MKKMLQIFAVVIAATITLNAHAWGELSDKKTGIQGIKSIQKISAIDDMGKSGFYLHYTPFLPSANYGQPKQITYSGEDFPEEFAASYLRSVGKFGFGHGLEFGNMFRLVNSDPIAIGLKVTWFGFGVAAFKAGAIDASASGFVVDLRALKLGPYFTYILNDQMAVDAFYQVAPTLMLGAFSWTDDNIATETLTYPIVAGGFTHELGVTYRFDMLSVGVGYGLGSTKLKISDGSETLRIVSNANTLRFMLGMKF